MAQSANEAGSPSLSRELEAQRALDLAYRHLGKRDRTVAEVRAHLASKDVDGELADGAIAELIVQGYLDDTRYATLFAEDRRSLDGWGQDRIARRLRELGVATPTIEGVLQSHDTETELEAAVALLQRRFRTPPTDERGRERALGFLARKGYALEVAYDGVRAFERATPSADD